MIILIPTKKKGDYFNSMQKKRVYFTPTLIFSAKWDFNYDKGNYDKRLQTKIRTCIIYGSGLESSLQ